MSLRLYPPGTRKGNAFWLIRGCLRGHTYEKSTGTRDESFAKQILREYEGAIEAAADAQPGTHLTFTEAVERAAERSNATTMQNLLQHAEAFHMARDRLNDETADDWERLTPIERDCRKAMCATLMAVAQSYRDLAKLIVEEGDYPPPLKVG